MYTGTSVLRIFYGYDDMSCEVKIFLPDYIINK